MIIDELKKIDWTFANENPRPGRHKLHAYPATMIAPCVQKILDIINPKKVLDPFSGSGTVMWECLKRDIEFHGNDLNSLSILIMKSKIQKDCNNISKLIENIKKLKEKYTNNIKEAKEIRNILPQEQYEKDNILKEIYEEKLNKKFPSFKNISYWFMPDVIFSLQTIKEELPDDSFSRMCFSECVRIVSNRRSGEFKLFRRSKEDLKSYNPEVFDQFVKILIKNLTIFENDTYAGNKIPILYQLDARNLRDIPDNYFDCMITSPPYGDSHTTVAYGQFSRLSLQWLDYDEPNIDNKLLGGSKSSQNKLTGSISNLIDELKNINESRGEEVQGFFSDLQESFLSIDSKIQSDGYHFWVVGNRTVAGNRLPLDLFIKEIGEECNYEHIGTLPRNIPYKSMPKQNSPSNKSGKLSDTMSEESIVVLKKRNYQ